jgi:hypothetical protein
VRVNTPKLSLLAIAADHFFVAEIAHELFE